MILLGAIVNALTVFFGGLLGAKAGTLIPQRHSTLVMSCLQIAVFVLGVKFASASENFLLLVLSLVIGALIGETLNIDRAMTNFGNTMQQKLRSSGGNFTSAFLSATLLYCVGSMAILASIESGIRGQHEIHFTKALLDGIAAVFLASSMGAGIAFSGISIFIYQGLLTMLAGFVAPFATPEIITEMSASGGIVLMALSLTMLEIKPIKVANLIPALFMPAILMLTPWF